MIRSSRLIPLVVLVGSLLAWSACSKKETLQFPAGFLFGTAIAGFQVEMGCPTIAAATCEDRHSDWYTFISDPTLVADTSLHLNGDPPGSGPGFYELYEGDLDRAQNELKSNTLRLSIEWSRVFPTSTVGVTGYDNLKALADPTALAYYHALFTALKAHNLKPFVTLNHYTLPTWIHDAAGCHRDLAHCSPRGWLDANTPVEIAKYAGFVAQEFGADVDLWATLNEPFTAVVLAGYLQPGDARTNPPAVTLQWDAAKLAIQNMIKAHNLMAIAVKAADTVDADGDGKAARVGLVYNVQATSPRTNSFVDKQGARNLSYLMNEMFLDGAINGDLDLKLDGTKEHHDELSGNTD
ncbi:MAG: glycoside hydrolase family 1 protein, partial [Deltaproteobacteria bacterium]|nr:glycoside hydrolase family 1 protein [Deltaproteobacteria bacterium]